MKKIIWSLHVVILFMSCSAFAQVCPPASGIMFKDERVIDTASFIKPSSEVQYQESDFAKYYVLNGKPWETVPETFAMQAMLKQLYCPVLERIQKDEENCSNKRCVAAIKIRHGLNGNNVKILYQPVYLRLDSVDVHSRIDSLHYSIVDSLDTYEYNSGTHRFTSVTLDQFKNYRKHYFSTIRKNSEASNTSSARYLNRLVDTEAVIFSFQEIVKFYHAVYKQTGSTYDYSKELKIHHGAVYKHRKKSLKEKTNGEDIRHTLFMTHKEHKKDGSQKVLTISGEDDGANLGHLCPPRCSNLTYPAGQ